MQCLHNRLSYASWRLRVFNDLFTPSLARNPTSTRTIFTSPPAEEPDSAPKPKRKRAPRAKKPLPSDSLPQSPLTTHPGLPPARTHKKRPPTPADLINLQNPWMRALAAPVRVCTMTGVRAPTTFLTEWGLVTRPERPNNWILPVGLLEEELDKSDPVPTFPGQITPHNRPRHILRMRYVDRLPTVKNVTQRVAEWDGRGRKSPLSGIIPQRFKVPAGPLRVPDEMKMIWRRDMPGFVTVRMRGQAMKKVKAACEKFKKVGVVNEVWRVLELEDGFEEAGLVEGVKGLESIKRMGTGAVWVVGSGSRFKAEEEGVSLLPDFVTLPQTDSKVPVFDLGVLFSEADLEELRESHPAFRTQAVFFRPADPVSIDAMLALWRLQGFFRKEVPSSPWYRSSRNT